MTPAQRNLRAVALIIITLAACALMLSRQQLAAAKSTADAAATAHASTLSQARRVAELESRAELVSDRARPEPDLVARLTNQLQSVGANASAFAGVSLTNRPLASGEGMSRQTAEVRLAGLDTPRLARFLGAWKESEPLWIVRSIRLQHNAGPSRNRDGLTAESFDVRLTLESVHWQTGPSAREGTRS